MLILALAVAAAFAALGQWQLARAVATGTVVQRSTETVLPLNRVAQPQTPMTGAADQQMVTVTGTFVPEDYRVLSDRVNFGRTGFWLVGHLSMAARPGSESALAVAVGWAATEADARAAILTLPWADGSPVTLTGRYLASESPAESDFEHGKASTMSVAALINQWAGFDSTDVYAGYLVSHQNVNGLERIDSPPPITDVTVNWLNIFYAAEWAIFAGFAVFLWYRLVKDAWEREQEQEAELD